jgi:tRNA modification GTPase
VTASEAPVVTSPRHKEALNRALDHVNAARAAHDSGISTDLIAIDVTAAVNALGEITGQTAGEDLIETIFGNFCVGK